MHTDHLLFAMGFVATGPDAEGERLVELAAVVVLPRCLEDEPFDTSLTFHALIRPDGQLAKQVSKETGLNPADLEEQDSFAPTFTRFLDWLQAVVREARRKTAVYLISALIGHFAYWTDFRLLLQEIDRHFPRSIYDMIGLWCQFSDSWELVNRLKRLELVDKSTKTGLENLYKGFCSKELKGDRAMMKAVALSEVLLSSNLRPHLNYSDFLTLVAFKAWCDKERPFSRFFDDLLEHYGLDTVAIDLMQTLSYRKMDFQQVCNVFWTCRNSVHFRLKMKTLHKVNLSPDEASELYRGCRAASGSCGCFRSWTNQLWGSCLGTGRRN